MQNTRTAFVGRITISADARNAAYRVKLYIGEAKLEIISTEGDEWSWDMSEVTITRHSVDRFHLSLANEHLYFLPVDTNRFLTEVVQDHSDSPLEPHRGWLRRRIEEAQAHGGDDSGYELDEGSPKVETPTSGRRGHVHEWVVASAVGFVTRRCVNCGQVSIDATGMKPSLEASLQTA